MPPPPKMPKTEAATSSPTQEEGMSDGERAAERPQPRAQPAKLIVLVGERGKLPSRFRISDYDTLSKWLHALEQNGVGSPGHTFQEVSRSVQRHQHAAPVPFSQSCICPRIAE